MEKDEVMIMCEIQEMTKLFVVEYSLLWLDPYNQSQAYQQEVEKMEVMYDLKISTAADWKDVKDQIEKEKTTYHLIISGVQDESILKEMANISNVSSIFLFDDNFSASLNHLNSQKIKCVETNIEGLLLKIDECLVKWQREESSLRTDFPAFAHIFDDYDKSNLNYLHYYLQGLTNFQNRDQAKRDFISLAKQIDKNKSDLKNFENAYNDYDPESILNWYTKPCFVYKMTNNCLRIATSDSIQYCRFVLKDLEAAIKEQFRKKSKNFHGLLYRGAFMSSQDWEKLKNNVGRDIEMHGFLSTSKEEEVAFNFLQANPDQKVFITIVVPPCSDKEEQGFVDIKEFSYFKKEEEILFNVRSRFTILDVGTRSFQGKQCRHVILLYGKQAWKIETFSTKKIFKIDVKSQKCSNCKKGIEDKFFVSITSPRQYLCEPCLRSSFQREYTPLLSIDPKKKETLSTQEPLTFSIEGEILIHRRDKRTPFYGYKCSKCQQKRISAAYYFKCLSCPNERNLWCKKCQRCQEENHHVIVERSGFSFWSEKLSLEEKDFLNYQLEEVRKNKDQQFHQGEVFLKGQEYFKARQYYEKAIEQQQHEDQIHRAYHGLGLVYKELGELKKAVTCFNKALDVQELSNSNPDAQTAKNYHELGVAYKILGDFKISKQYYEKGLEIRKAIYQDQHQEIAESYDGIAWVYETLGDFEQALMYYQKGLEMFRQVYGENHPLTAKSYHNLATVYSTQGDNKKAVEIYEKILESNKLVLGGFHPDTAFVYSSLGLEYSKGIDINKSIEFLNTSIEILKAIYGDENQQIIIPYNNLATVYMDSGKYSEALELYEKTLKIGIDIFGENNPSLALYYENLGAVFLKLQEMDKAREHLFKCLDILKAVYNTEKHNEIASCYCKLAAFYKESNNNELALEHNYKALEIYQSIFGENHPQVGACYHNIARMYMVQYQYPKAIEYYLKNVKIAKKIFCEYNTSLAITYCSLALVYEKMGNYDNCIEYNKKALVIFDAFYGTDHVDTATCYNQMGACFRRAGDLAKAFEYHERALRIYKASFQDSENHEEIALSYDLLGSTYREKQEFEAALEYHEKCLEIRRKVDATAPWKIAESLLNIGQVHQKLGDSLKAAEFFTQVMNKSEEEDMNTCQAYSSLALIYYKEKKYEESREYFEKSLKLSLKFYGENHEQVAVKYSNWTTAEIMCKNFESAEELLLKSLKIKQEIFGEFHPKLKSDCMNLSRIYKVLKNEDKATYFREMVVNIEAQQAGA